MERSLYHRSIVNFIALGLSVSTPLVLFRDNLPGTLGGFAGGLATGVLLGQRKRKWVESSASVSSIDPPQNSPQLRPNPAPATPAPNKDGERIKQWLASLNIQVLSSGQPEPGDEVKDRLAWDLGEKAMNPSLASFYGHLKCGIAQNTTVRFYLSGKSQHDVNLCVQFARQLHNNTFLNACYYDKNNKTLLVTPPENGSMRNFLSGKWLERYVYQKLSRYFQQENIEFQCLINPILQFANGDKFELDLLFWIDNSPLWIECKTGSIYSNNVLTSYTRHQRNLQIDQTRSILVGYNLPEGHARDLSNIWNFTFVNYSDVLEVIELPDRDDTDLMNSEVKESPRYPSVTPQGSLSSKPIATILKQCNMRPSPDYRSIVLQELVKLFSTPLPPVTRKEIRDILSQKLQNTQLNSNGKINEILTVLIRQNVFVDHNNNPVQDHLTPISGLRSLDPNFLEHKCLEKYIEVILQHRSNFFDNFKNIQEFQETIGTDASPAIIREIVDRFTLSAS